MTSHHCPKCSGRVSVRESEAVGRIVGSFLTNAQVADLAKLTAGSGTGIVDELCPMCLNDSMAELA